MVREALLGSVTWSLPPESCHASQVSTVPKASSPRSARARRPGAENFSGVVFDPAGLRKMLAELLLRRGARGPALVEHDGAGTRRSLVEREHVAHGKF